MTGGLGALRNKLNLQDDVKEQKETNPSTIADDSKETITKIEDIGNKANIPQNTIDDIITPLEDLAKEEQETIKNSQEEIKDLKDEIPPIDEEITEIKDITEPEPVITPIPETIDEKPTPIPEFDKAELVDLEPGLREELEKLGYKDIRRSD